MQEQLQKQFQTEGHKAILNKASVTNWKDPEKKSQRHWMQTSKTIGPYDNNIAKSVCGILLVYWLLFSAHYYFYSDFFLSILPLFRYNL